MHPYCSGLKERLWGTPILFRLKGRLWMPQTVRDCWQVIFSQELQTGRWAQRPSKKVVPPCPLPK